MTMELAKRCATRSKPMAGRSGTLRRACVASILVALSFSKTAFLAPEGRGPSKPNVGRRQELLGSMASMLCAKEAQAVGVAFDYRKLDEIDPSTRKIVGDLKSEKAQKAIALISDAKQKAETLFRNYKEDVTVRWKPFLTPIPEMRTAVEEIQEL
eukprot:s1141_g12.t1